MYAQRPCDLESDLYAKNCFLDFVATGDVVFYKHILFTSNISYIKKVKSFPSLKVPHPSGIKCLYFLIHSFYNISMPISLEILWKLMDSPATI